MSEPDNEKEKTREESKPYEVSEEGMADIRERVKNAAAPTGELAELIRRLFPPPR